MASIGNENYERCMAHKTDNCLNTIKYHIKVNLFLSYPRIQPIREYIQNTYNI